MSEFIKSYQLNIKFLDALQNYIRAGEMRGELTTEEKAEFVRAKRDAMLRDSDFAVLPDSPLTKKTEQEAWKTYRQALRDVPEQEGFPEDVVWPVSPK